MVSTKTKNKIFLKKNLTRKITKQDKVKDKLFRAIYAAVTSCQKIRKVQCTHKTWKNSFWTPFGTKTSKQSLSQ